MQIENLARVGDRIEMTVRHPTPGTIQIRVLTPEACAHANLLLMDSTSGWRLVQPAT